MTARTDKELDLYFGGRESYLASVHGAIERLEAEISSGVPRQQEPGFAEIFGTRTLDDARNELAQYQAALAENKQ